MAVIPKTYTEEDHETWRTVLKEHAPKRHERICDIFLEGVEILDLNEERIPCLNEVNRILKEHSGFQGVLVDGLKDGESFYQMLARREFPVGNFIRSRQDLGYTPAPDIVHDLYGHLPFFTDKAYADFCQEFGKAASTYFGNPELLRQFERFFWFTIEFGLVKTVKGLRIFGAGIASSTAECEYALGATPTIMPFNIDLVRRQDFRIDEMQPRLFCLESPQQLYNSLKEFCYRVERDHRKGFLHD